MGSTSDYASFDGPEIGSAPIMGHPVVRVDFELEDPTEERRSTVALYQDLWLQIVHGATPYLP